MQEAAESPFPASLVVKTTGKTVREVCEIFLSDPTKNRSDKAASGYWNAVELAETVLGKSKVMADIDRQCARDIVATLKWVPSNAKKRFPSLDYRQAAEKGRTGRYRLLGPKSVNDYLIKLSTLSNFAIDEGFIGRNPFRGLKVADDVHPRDKRYPFSTEQLVRIFNAPSYLTGPQFKQRVEAVIEKFNELQADLNKERTFMMRQWASSIHIWPE